VLTLLTETRHARREYAFCASADILSYFLSVCLSVCHAFNPGEIMMELPLHKSGNEKCDVFCVTLF